MQRSEHPSGLFAGLAEIDPLFVWQGDGVGIALTVVAASFSPVIRSRLSRWSAGVIFRESHALGKRMAGSCQGASPLSPGIDKGMALDLRSADGGTPWSNQPSDFVRRIWRRSLVRKARTNYHPCGDTWIPLRLCVRHSARREALLELFPDMATIKTTDSPDRSHRLCLGFDDE